MCACCSKPKRRCETLPAESKYSDASEAIVNQFESFSLIEDRSSTVEDDLPSASCTECREQGPPACPGSQKEVALADDDLGNRFQVAIILQVCFNEAIERGNLITMQQVLEHVTAIQEVWRQSGKGVLHFSTAAFATNMTYAALTCLESELRDTDEGISISEIAEMCCTTTLSNTEIPDSTTSGAHNLIRRLQNTETALKHYTDEHQPIKIASCSTCIQRPADYVQSAPAFGEADQSRLNSALVDNILHLITAEKARSNIVRNSSPVYADLGHILAHRDEAPNTVRLTIGLDVLSESYQAYLFNSHGRAPSAICRLTALKLAQQAAKSVHAIIDDKTCFPCRCPQTLAYHLQNLEVDLISYSKQRCWDLYFQSPWVAGNHILEMLDLCHYYGQKLFRYRHYVGSVLHSYNALQQLAGLEKVPLLEWLCTQFEATFFPGGRPKISFRPCWTRYIGARIKFKKGHRSRNQRDSWCMAIPAHAARRAAGLGVGGEARDGKDESLLSKIKQQDYNVTDAQWEAFTAGQNPQDRLKALTSAIEKELFPKDDAAIPAARVNHFTVFASCVKVISSLSDASHMDAKEQGINCICFASAILDGADRIVNARKMGKVAGAAWTKAEKEGVVDLTMKTIIENIRSDAWYAERWAWDI